MHHRIILKREILPLCPRAHTHVAYFIGASSNPLACLNRIPDQGYAVYTLNGEGCGLHDTMARAKMAIVELIINNKGDN